MWDRRSEVEHELVPRSARPHGLPGTIECLARDGSSGSCA